MDLLSGHMYRTQFYVGTGMSSLLLAHRAEIMNSWHAQLAINLGTLGTGSRTCARTGPPSFPSSPTMPGLADYWPGSLRGVEKVLGPPAFSSELHWGY